MPTFCHCFFGYQMTLNIIMILAKIIEENEEKEDEENNDISCHQANLSEGHLGETELPGQPQGYQRNQN